MQYFETLPAAPINQVINLGGRFTTTRSDFCFYQGLVEMLIPDMEPGKNYTLEKMFGTDIWEGFGDYERKLIGKCVAKMVMNGLLPLRFAGSIKTNPKRYRLE